MSYILWFCRIQWYVIFPTFSIVWKHTIIMETQNLLYFQLSSKKFAHYTFSKFSQCFVHEPPPPPLSSQLLTPRPFPIFAKST